MSQTPEVIVIGSGAGGLTAAVALANSGKRVLVLEQHHRAGGWCHSFERQGFKFSPGVHYIGELGEGQLFRAILQGLGVTADLSFCEINPDGFDHVTVVDNNGQTQRLDIPADRSRLAELLKQRFPGDRRGIERFFRRMMKVGNEFMEAEKYLSGWRVLQLPFRVPNLILFGSRMLAPYLSRITRDPVLQTFLAAQSGIYAMPPSQTSILLASTLTHHYGAGAHYPLGGAESIPRALIRQLERQGGVIRLSSEVESIVVEGGRAAGVQLADGERIDARWIVSNGDPEMTLGRLVGTDRLSPRTAKRLRGTSYSLSCFSLFLATDLDLRGMGLDSGNYWFYGRPDLDGIYRRIFAGLPDAPEFFFLSVPTLKDPSLRRDGLHTVEVFAFVPYEPFARWAGQPCQRRDQEYQRLKRSLADQLLTAAERFIPGLREHVVFQEAGTPLTNQHYCRAHQGAMYGTAKTNQQIALRAYPVRTEIEGLLMAGASTFFHGVFGAATSGLMAASEITGLSFEELLKVQGPEPRVYPAERPDEWVPRPDAGPTVPVTEQSRPAASP